MTDLSTTLALCSLEELKDFLDLTKAGADEALKRIINSVSADCQNRYCRRIFLLATYTDEKHDGSGNEILWTKNYPVTQITSITPYEDATALTVSGTEFDFDPISGEIHLRDGRVFVEGFQNVKITYSAGYDGIDNLPEDLRQSVVKASAHKWNEQSKKTYSVEEQDKGEAGSARYIETPYPKDVIEIWKLYRKFVYA